MRKLLLGIIVSIILGLSLIGPAVANGDKVRGDKAQGDPRQHQLSGQPYEWRP